MQNTVPTSQSSLATAWLSISSTPSIPQGGLRTDPLLGDRLVLMLGPRAMPSLVVEPLSEVLYNVLLLIA